MNVNPVKKAHNILEPLDRETEKDINELVDFGQTFNNETIDNSSVTFDNENEAFGDDGIYIFAFV